MDPLQAAAVPTHCVLIGMNAQNSWACDPNPTAAGQTVRLAYIATNSTQRMALLSVEAGLAANKVLRIGTRPSSFDDMASGLVLELHLATDLAEDETVYLTLAQAGATSYYPPQQIDDTN